MNYLKNKTIIKTCILFVMAIAISFFVNNQRELNVKIISSIKDIHIYENRFECSFYTTKEHLNLFDKSSIYDIYLKYNDGDYIALNYDNLEQTNIKYNIDEEEYYQNKLSFSYNIEHDNLEFEDPVVNINYNDSNTLDIKVGSIYKHPNNKSNDLIVSKMKGITSYTSNIETLFAVVFNIKNLTENDIVINDINTTNANVNINKSLIKKVEYNEFDKIMFNENYLNYSVLNTYDQHFNPLIVKNESSLEIVIPLTYDNISYINSIGFELNYTYKDIIKLKTIKNFSFYKNYNHEKSNIYTNYYYL